MYYSVKQFYLGQLDLKYRCSRHEPSWHYCHVSVGIVALAWSGFLSIAEFVVHLDLAFLIPTMMTIEEKKRIKICHLQSQMF